MTIYSRPAGHPAGRPSGQRLTAWRIGDLASFFFGKPGSKFPDDNRAENRRFTDKIFGRHRLVKFTTSKKIVRKSPIFYRDFFREFCRFGRFTTSKYFVRKSPIFYRDFFREFCHFGRLLPSYFKAETR